MNCSTLHIEVIPSLIILQETGDTGNPVGPAAPGQASDAVAIVDGDAGAAGSDSPMDPFGGNFFLILMLFVLGMIVSAHLADANNARSEQRCWMH